jgi:hypothetical protein
MADTTAAPPQPPSSSSSGETDLEFYFDPACPWTWLTSRWLVDAAPRRGRRVTWRSLSLWVLNEGKVPEAYAGRVRSALLAHRLFAALTEAGRNDLVGAVYTAIGTRVHDGSEDLTPHLVREAAAAAGAGSWAAAIDDESWDAAVELSTKQAVDLAGPDVGSPVLAHGSPRVAMFGPIVNPGPRGEDGARLLDLALAAAQVGGLFELKRGRREGPSLPAPPPGT